MNIDGLVSGLDTTKIINSLMDVAAIPKNQITAKITDRTSVITNLQSLNASLQDLVAKAKTAKDPHSLGAFTATASSDAVKVVVGASASRFSTGVVVDAIARAHSVVTAAGGATTWSGPFTVVGADGKTTEIPAGAASAAELAKNINAAKAGVTASVVPAGTAADGTPLSRLQLTATATGAANTFSLQRGTAADVATGTSVDITTEQGAAIVTAGSDARIRLFAGTAAEQSLTSADGSFTVGEGITVTAVKTTSDPVTVAVSPDTKAQSTTAETFVKQVSALLTRIDNGSKATIGAPGKDTTLGVFTGDSTVRALRGALASAVQSPVDGVSPSTIGISIDQYGALSFDADRFATAMAADPERTQAMFSAISARVESAAGTYSDKYDGLLTRRITGQQSEVKSLQDQSDAWDIRLAQRRATLERTYATLETQLSALQSQSSWLSGQLGSLPQTKSSPSS
ncbi:flagellar filament capping protein FliD [uncultured Microbacterium sp.]|uniref:flagellar filament capping protein FliD n=1 Tax=uncultured Microbacterium sp. TaxID=191216 RepID=UPI0025D16258|nr:flagellar filament capping protein FliD [uncultured Microbacterium sp.]